MSGRGGFLALVGGSMVTGVIGARATQQPTLLLPAHTIVRATEMPALTSRSSMQQTARGLIEEQALLIPPEFPLLAAEKTQMHAFIHVKAGLPDELFFDWLEGGLRAVEGCKPGGSIYRAMQADLASGLR